MKKIFFLIFMCFVASGAMAVVDGGVTAIGCEAMSNMMSCNNASTSANSCYWGYTRKTSGMVPAYMCYECANTPITDYIKIATDTEVQPIISLHTSKTEYIQDGYFYQYLNTYGFCPIEVRCPSGYGLKLIKDEKCQSLVVGSDCDLYVSCNSCGGNFDREVRMLRLYDSGDYFYVTNVKTDIEGNSIDVVEQATEDHKYGCGMCGINAEVNGAGNDCNCLDGYAYYDSAGRVNTSNIGEGRDCVARTYTIYLNTDTTAYTGNTIKYRPGYGYDLDGDGEYGTAYETFLNDGEFNVQIKKNFEGWYFFPKSEGVESGEDGRMWAENRINHTDDIVSKCKEAESCDIDEKDQINLYKHWSWLKYNIDYGEYAERGECTYNQSCKLSKPIPEKVPDGKLFSRWLAEAYDAKMFIPGEDIVDWEKEVVFGFLDGLQLVMLTEPCPAGFYCISNERKDCPEGYYCSGSTGTPIPCDPGNFCPKNSSGQTECPKGYYCEDGGSEPKLCPAGTTTAGSASDISGCFISSATEFVDSSGIPFMLPVIDGQVYVK